MVPLQMITYTMLSCWGPSELVMGGGLASFFPSARVSDFGVQVLDDQAPETYGDMQRAKDSLGSLPNLVRLSVSLSTESTRLNSARL